MSAAIAVRGDSQLGVERACALLAKCVSVDEAKNIRDQAAAMKAYLRQQRGGRDAKLNAAEIQLRAERRLGELIAEQEKARGTRGRGRPKKGGCIVQPPSNDVPSYGDLGIEKTAAKRWQDMARVPESKFEGYLREARTTQDGDLTTKGALAAGREPKEKQEEPFHILVALVEFKESIRELAAEWPLDRRYAIPEALRDLAIEFEVSNAR